MWPLMQLEMDIIEPPLNEKGGKKYVFLIVDYFTKLIEVESYVLIKDRSQNIHLEKHYLSI